MKKLFISIVAVLFAATFSFAQNTATVDQTTGSGSWVNITQIGAINTVAGLSDATAIQTGTGYGEFTTVQWNNGTSLINTSQTGATTTSYLNVAQYTNTDVSFYNDQKAGNGWNVNEAFQIGTGTGGANVISNTQVAGLQNNFLGVQLGSGNTANINQNSTIGNNAVLNAPNLPSSPTDWTGHYSADNAGHSYSGAAGVFQNGNNNTIASIDMTLGWNLPNTQTFPLPWAIGTGNASQTGAGNNSLGITQDGNSNSVGLYQNNSAGTNDATMYQSGSSNRAFVYQDGIGANTVITNQSIGGLITNYQSGASNYLNVTQH